MVRVTLGFLKNTKPFFLKKQVFQASSGLVKLFYWVILALLAQAKRLTNRKFDLSLTQFLVKAVGQFGSV